LQRKRERIRKEGKPRQFVATVNVSTELAAGASPCNATADRSAQLRRRRWSPNELQECKTKVGATGADKPTTRRWQRRSAQRFAVGKSAGASNATRLPAPRSYFCADHGEFRARDGVRSTDVSGRGRVRTSAGREHFAEAMREFERREMRCYPGLLVCAGDSGGKRIDRAAARGRG